MKRRKTSISGRVRRLFMAFAFLTTFTVMMIVFTGIYYKVSYQGLIYNISTASEFNRDFKTDVDLKMYYYVIESRYSEGLPMDEVNEAKALAEKLRESTKDRDSLQAITSVLDLSCSLEEAMLEIEQTESYDERQLQLENNIYVLTALIQEYMYDYLYFEAVQINNIQNELEARLMLEIIVILIIIGSAFIILLNYSRRIGRSVSEPVEKLSRRMQEIGGGDLSPHEPVSSDINEIDTLSTGVEQMVGEMNTLIKEGTDRQETLRKTELALLQAQINPHFLYNTMDTIMWLIEAGSSEKAVRMVSDLSDFFRHSLSNGKDVVTLGDEEQQITSYLQIQQVRYKDILSFSIDIDDGIKNLNVPKLTLQPLIENALYHGVKEKRGKGKITVTGKEENGTVILSVKDDGAGISEERLDELKEAFVTGERIGFGLVTVHERLKLFFGDAYNIDVKSKEGEGTEISLMIRRTDDETV